MLKKLKSILKGDRSKFEQVNKICDLNLDYNLNRNALKILEEVFVDRRYSGCFPFYEEAVVVDVGAHYGYFSLFASRNLDPKSTIISLEPSPSNYKILSKNILDCKVKNVQLLDKAIGAETGEQTLHLGRSVNHSLIKDYSLLSEESNSVQVDVLDLEGLMSSYNLGKIDFLKMDCEGAEYDILLKASEPILKKIKVISMEFHDLKTKGLTGNDLVGKLRKSGFEILRFDYDHTRMNLNFGKIVAKRK